MEENFIFKAKRSSRKALLATIGIVVTFITTTPGVSFLFTSILKFMAHTGKGSDTLIRKGIMLFPVHFYYPAPDVLNLEKNAVFDKKSMLHGIDFNDIKQLDFLRTVSSPYAHECNFPSEKPLKQEDFYTENGCFSYGCAALLHCIIRKYKPKRIVEVGIGNSSKIISRALFSNFQEGFQTEYVAIDPYPPTYVEHLNHLTKLIPKPVEEMDLALFTSLEANDILFIDSSHQVKIGNDVLFLYLEVLPILKPGVLVHIHDINLPYEYPKAYFLNENFRVCWNEQYLLQALLVNNSTYQVLLGATNLMANHLEKFKEAFPLYNSEKHISASGSFWMQRINQN